MSSSLGFVLQRRRNWWRLSWNNLGIRTWQRNPIGSVGVGDGVDKSVRKGDYASGVQTKCILSSDTLQVLAPENMTAVQRAHLGRQLFDEVGRPGM